VRVLQADHHGQGPGDVQRVSSAADVARLAELAAGVHVSDELFAYIASLVAQTRRMPELRLGASPRGALGLLRAARVKAALDGRPYVVPGDIQDLAVSVLAHRVLVAHAFDADGGTAVDAITRAVSAVPAPPAALRR
jgi:MoxR-like ATPase